MSTAYDELCADAAEGNTLAQQRVRDPEHVASLLDADDFQEALDAGFGDPAGLHEALLELVRHTGPTPPILIQQIIELSAAIINDYAAWLVED